MTLQVLDPVTIPDLLGRDLGDELGLSLTSAPVHLIHRDSATGARYAILTDAALDRRGLMDLLFTVAPYKAHGPDRFSRVLDNWALFERAKSSSTSERLLLEHAESLKLSWEEFARHREVFVEVLEDSSGHRHVVPLLSWSRGLDGKRRWEFEPDEALWQTIEGISPDIRRDGFDTLVGLVTIPYFLPELRRNWRDWQPLKKGGKSNYIGPASVPVMALMHSRALLNSTLIQRAEAYVSAGTM